MSNFKIGERVLCVDDSNTKFIKQGGEYLVMETSNCSRCNEQYVYIGIDRPAAAICYCGKCNYIYKESNNYFGSYRFVRADSAEYAETLLEEIEVEIEQENLAE